MSVDQLLPVVVGALIALAGSLAVQLFLVPRAEARRRFDERWEQAVLDLGQSLVFDESAGRLRNALKSVYEAVQPPEAATLSREQMAARLTAKQFDDLSEALQPFTEQFTRFRWLADRVMFFPSAEPRMQQMRLGIVEHLVHSFALLGITQHAVAARMDARVQVALPDYAASAVSLQERLDPRHSYSLSDLNDTYAALTDNRARLVTALQDLANAEPPRRVGLIRKLSHRLARANRTSRRGPQTE